VKEQLYLWFPEICIFLSIANEVSRGYDRNILDVYEEALDNGEALITVPCAQADSRHLARLMLPHGAHGVIYFGPGTAETLTAP